MKAKERTTLLVRLAALVFWIAGIQRGAAANHTVQMTGNFTFVPPSLTIAKGDSVTWNNTSGFTHTSTSGSGCAANGLWNSGSVSGGSSFTFPFTNASFTVGTYPYFCVPHCLGGMVGTIVIANPPNARPSVTITNPASGSEFAAPANVMIQATASDSDGSVTNVQFFSGANLLGSAASAPYRYTVSNLSAGSYSFTARAVDNLGLGATSAPVSVSIFSRPTLVSPVLVTNGQFEFTVMGVATQVYVTEVSTNLTSWLAISTNTAPSNTFKVLDPTATNLQWRFYRVRETH